MVRRAILTTLSLVIAISALAAGHQWDVRTTAITIQFDRFMLATRLPEGWSVDGGQPVPPVEMRHACHVRGDVFRDRDWNRTLAAELEPNNAARAGERRVVCRVGGHVAVRNDYVNASKKRIENIYVDLADLEPGSIAIWRFEGDGTEEGNQCEMGFDTFVGSASIVLRPDAGAPPDPDAPVSQKR